MKDNPHLLTLVQFVLPEEIFQYFEIIKIKEQGKELHIYLDEINEVPSCYSKNHILSKGFHDEAIIKDFPIRNKACMLHVRRRRWLNEDSGKVVNREWDLTAQGTRYTQDFATFLKGLIGYLPDTKSFP
jgi:transposase